MDENRQKKSPLQEIRIIFLVSIAIRKFQRLHYQNSKRSLSYDFDKQSVLNKLKDFYANNEELFKQHLTQLAEINPLDIPSIVELYKKTSFSQNIKNAFSDLLMQCGEKWENIQSYSQIISSILDLPDLSDDAKAFFLCKIESCNDFCANGQLNIQINTVTKLMTTPKVKKNQLVVSKTIQTVRAKLNTNQSEETDFQLLDVMNGRFKNKKINCNSVREDNLDEFTSWKGIDLVIRITDWSRVHNLYTRVHNQGQVVKNSDKDEYLPLKFLGHHFLLEKICRHECFGIYSFFINRMCVSIFLKISRKQELNDKAIDKLIECITDFDSLMKVLNLKKDFKRIFVEVVFSHYWEFKKLKSPDFAVTILKEIINKTTEEFQIERRFWKDGTGVSRKSYNEKEVENLLIREINQVRSDAIKALYNSVIRNKKHVLTVERLDKIRDYAKNAAKDCQSDNTFLDHIIMLNELAETQENFDYRSTFEVYHNHLKNSLPVPKVLIDASLRFMKNQARDSNRAKELFTNEKITSLIDCVKPNASPSLSIAQKYDVMNTINIYLEHGDTDALNDENVKELLDNTFLLDIADTKLIKLCFTALLLSVDKTRRCPDLGTIKHLFQSLIENEDCTSFLVFILSRIFCAATEDQNCIKDIDLLELISTKMFCQKIIELNENDDDEDKVNFEDQADKNQGCSNNKISLLASRIVLKSVENRIFITSTTIENLILVLTCNDEEEEKQTKIVSAKIICKLSDFMALSAYLNKLLELMNSSVYDISIYIRIAYIRGCEAVSYAPNPLDSIHMENISSNYVEDDTLKLGENDYKEEINTSFFNTLQHEARKQDFIDKNLFAMFNHILNMNEKYAPQVLSILVIYSFKFEVPVTTVRILENLLCFSNYFEKALLVLKNVISGRSLVSVTSKTFDVFIDYLHNSTNSTQRFDSFKLLERASQKQEITDSIFYQIELVRAGYALKQGNTIVAVIECIQKLVNNGMKLPIDTKLALEQKITHEGVLRVFATVSKNKQIIDQHLLNTLAQAFHPIKDVDDKIISKLHVKIFENAAKNNQMLPPELLVRLESALHDKVLKQHVLPVFIYLAQRGDILSQHVITELLDKLLNIQDPVLKQELLSSLGSLIEANQGHIQIHLSKINEIIIKEIKSDNFNIQKLCIGTVYTFVRIFRQIDDKLLEHLVQVGTDPNTNKFIRCEVHTLFESVITDDMNPLIVKNGFRERIQLGNLNFTSPEHLLYKLRFYVKLQDGFLLENYRQLKEVIDSGSLELQKEVLNLLHDCTCKSEISDELVESVAILYESTMLQELRKSCLKLFIEAVENGKTLNGGRALHIWNLGVNRDNNGKEFFQSQVCMTFRQDFGLNDQVISDLHQLIEDSEKISFVKDVSDFICLVVDQNNSDYPRNESFGMLIEQCLIKKRALEITLPSYCRITKEMQVCNKECLQMLAKHFTTNNEPDLETSFFECMYYINKFEQLPEICYEFVVKNLYNGNGIVRGYSCGILRTLNGRKKCKKFSRCLEVYSNKIFDSLKISKSKRKFHLLETIVSVKFLDHEVFVEMKREKWKRELLMSDIFERFKVLQLDKMQFYTLWFAVEKKFKSIESYQIISLIHKSNFQDFSQVIELLLMIPDLNFYEAKHILVIYERDPYEAFKRSWCLKKLKSCLLNKINEIYARKLVESLCSNFNVNVIGKLFCCIKSIDNLSAFEDIISFSIREKINVDGILDEIESVHLSDLKHLIESKHLCKIAINPPDSVQERIFIQITQGLNDAGWNFNQICKLVQKFGLIDDKFQNLLHFLSTIRNFKMPPSSFEQSEKILTDSKTFQEILQKINKLVIENHFQKEGKVKDLNELLTELKNINPLDKALVDLIDSGALDIRKHVFRDQAEKSSWNEKTILKWAISVKSGDKKEFTDYEAIAIILKANLLITGHTLTDTQILCCLIALRTHGENSKGKLLEVATGEGKSTIICILAIINALKGKNVDVITSSPVLAERDAKQNAKLYRMFSLTCSDNNDKTVYVKGTKNCYLADVVYGEMSQFQFDILRDNYSKLGTLGCRGFETAIVDEVDSMLIDDSSKIARLSSTVPGMDHLQPIYILLWQHLVSLKEGFRMFGTKLYFLRGKIGFRDGKTTLEFADDTTGEIQIIPDVAAFISEFGNNRTVCQLVDDIDEFLQKELEEYLESKIKKNDIYIPSNFKEFVKRQKSKWVTNAVVALGYAENAHYVVQNGQIKPVDYHSTGIVQSSTVWSDGLHQFLQIKHNIKMTSETLTTNFLSNIGFMAKYDQMYGLSGTLGSNTARDVLKDVYQVDVINIPQRRQKQFMELKSGSIIAESETSWLSELLSNILIEIKKDRGILVICETIEHANRINLLLKTKLRSSSIKLYTMNDMDQERDVEKIYPGEVIIATNLAGRGTDIQTDEIEETGGLHVILSFLPSNQRVEDQAFGRTARQGKRGTGIMILNGQGLVGFSTKNNIKKERDEIESMQLKEFKEKELELIQVKDKLFDKFCLFLNDKIRLSIRKKNSYAKKIKNCFTEILPTTFERCVLAAAEEQWAGFLSKLDDGIINCNDAEKQFSQLIDQLGNDFENQKLIKNPYYLISIGNGILENASSFPGIGSTKVQRALEYFQNAICLEESQNCDADKVHCPGAAYLGHARCLILLKTEDYKELALKSLKSALDTLSNEMCVLSDTQLLLEQRQNGFVNSDLYKQLIMKATIMGSYIQGVNSNIDAIKRSKRMIDLVSINRHNTDNHESVLETIQYFNDQERNKKKRMDLETKI